MEDGHSSTQDFGGTGVNNMEDNLESRDGLNEL